jgi:hypothetical protein
MSKASPQQTINCFLSWLEDFKKKQKYGQSKREVINYTPKKK